MAFLSNLVNAIRKRTLDKTNLDERLIDTIQKTRSDVNQGVQRVKNTPLKEFNLLHPDIFSKASERGATSLRTLDRLTQKARTLPEKEGIVDDYLRTSGNFSSNWFRSTAKGLEDVSQGISRKNLSGVTQVVRGGRTALSSVLPQTRLFSFGTNLISSLDKPLDKNDRVRRAAAGLYKGANLIDNVAENVPQRKTQLNILGNNVEFDPLVEGGRMVGFTQHPFNKAIFSATSKYLPSDQLKIGKRIANRVLRGGFEDIFLSLADIPDDATPEEKAKFMIKQFLWGASSENLAGLGEEGQLLVKKAIDSYGKQGVVGLAKIFDLFKKEAKRVSKQKTSEKVKQVMRRIPVNQYGNQIDEILLAETKATRRGTNGYQKKFKDFTPSGKQTRSSKSDFIQDPENPRRWILKIPKNTEELNAIGVVAGFEQDEDGKWHYNPVKGALGLGIATLGTKAAKGVDTNKPLQQGETLLKLPAAKKTIQKFMPDDGTRKELSEIEKILYGEATPEKSTLGGTREGAGAISNILREGQEQVSKKIGQLTASANPVVRNIARLAQGFAGGIGKSDDYIQRISGYRGAVDYANKMANDTQKFIAEKVNYDPKSLERIHAVLDPELAGTKVDFDNLTTAEKEATEVLRTISDYINDTNYKNGLISKENWAKNRGGKYLARAYEEYEYPPELADIMKQRDFRMDLNPFKKRGDITDWKKENAIKDPSYLVAKRLQQTMFNDEVKRMSEYLANQPELSSDIAKPGFEQLSDHKAWGDLAGKWVRKDVADDIKGFHFANDGVQKIYDVLTWWDRNPLRRGRKQLLTVFNPAVRLGNKTGNYVFAWMSGINPISFNKNRRWAKQAIRSNDALYRRLIKDGLMGSDASRADIQRFALELKNNVDSNPELIKSGGYKWIKRQIEEIQRTYRETDDLSKLAAMKTFLDRGYSYKEAIRRTLNSFQNYNTTGFLYDIGAKLPIFGNPFVRFQGDLMRILKNAAVDHPVRAVSTLMAWQGFTRAMSAISGETEADRETRESRVGSARIPFTDISLAVQTPWGEVNAARLVGVAAYTPIGGASVGSDLSKVMPFQQPNIRNIGSDPLVGPILATIADADFRGKSIADPDQNKYTGSLLTPEEKNINRAQYLLRQYLPPTVNDLTDVASAAQGKENFYGQKRTLPQALVRLLGLKVEQFGADEAQETRDRNASYAQSVIEAKQRQISSIKNKLERGEITPEEATKQIKYHQQQIEQQTNKLRGETGGIAPARRVGPARVQSLNNLFGMPTGLGEGASSLEKAKYQQRVFKKLGDVYDADWMDESEKASYISQVAGITEDQAKYYGIARLSDGERLAYILDQLEALPEDTDHIAYLATLREEVNDKKVLTNSVIDDLEDAGYLSDAQAKYLKKFKYNKSTGNIEYTGSSSSSDSNKKKAFQALKSLEADKRNLIDSLWNRPRRTNIKNTIDRILAPTKSSDIENILSKKRSFEAKLGKEPS